MTSKLIEQTTNLPLDLCKVISYLAKEPTKDDLIVTIKSQFPTIEKSEDFFPLLRNRCRAVFLYCIDCKKNIGVWTAQDNRVISLVPIHAIKGCNMEKCNCMMIHKHYDATIKKIPILMKK